MTIIDTPLEGCFVLEPTVYEDSRGYFLETFNQLDFQKLTGIEVHFVQDNESFSTKGVLRGLHYQNGAHAQAKLVRVIQGHVLDVAVDIRPNSPTFGQHFATELSETNKRQLFIPRGFAHGFVVLGDSALFSYKCDNYYHKAAEAGIRYNDSDLNIDWRLSKDQLMLSAKDKDLPLFNEITFE
jgi:dTDP-4-dehydrorhamnose 3,5-epimerase